MSDQVSRRVRAYRYVVQGARQANGTALSDSDVELAEALQIPLQELSWVKAGLVNPSPGLVAAFKKVCPQIDESDVNSVLVNPFMTES